MELDIKKQQKAVKDSLYKTVLILAGPAVVEMLLHMAVGIIDTAMVGRLGAQALAAVGLANMIIMLSTTVLSAIGTGNTALVARFIGANKPVEAGKSAQQATYLAVLSAIFVGTILFGFGNSILNLLFSNTDAEVIALSANYVRIVALAMIFHYCLILINSALRGAGDTKTPMRITAFVNIFNIIGNFLLIFGIGPFPALGVTGAAIATALSHVIGGILAFSGLLKNKKIEVSFKWPYQIDPAMIKRILRIGIPAAVEQGSMRIGQLFYTMIVASFGTVSYAAHQVALNAESLSFNPGFGFALAATTLVGQNLGSRHLIRAERSGHAAGHLAMLLMSCMGVIFFFFSKQIVYLFTPDQDVVELASACLKIIALSQPALAAQMVYAGGLRGAGDTKGILWITLSGFFAVRLGLTLIFVIVLKLELIGAWIAMSIDLYFRALLMWLRFRKGQWKTLKI